jgi:hypothetical protein
MIFLTFAIANPFFKSWRDFKNIRSWHGKLPIDHKYWEVEVMRDGYFVQFDFTFKTKCDHAGATLAIGILGYSINITAYDNRHWDNVTNTWCTND